MSLEKAGGYPLTRRGLVGAGALLAGAAVVGPAAAAAPAVQRFPRVAALVDGYVRARKLPGMIAALAEGSAPVEAIAAGRQGFNDPQPMTLDSLFRIYSMTKPITGMAAMMLVDEGKLRLDQSVADILPQFADMQVQVTPDGSLTDLRPAKTAITIRHLVTHTSGLGYALIQSGPIRDAFIARGVVAGRVSRIPIPGLERGTPVPSLEVFADRLAGLPLVYEPGAQWSYSVGLDLMGRVIEVVTGKRFDRFLAERLFAPLGMTSTWFEVPQAQAGRLATNYGVLAGLTIPIDPGGRDSIYVSQKTFPMGGAGLVSSPRDYDRFLAMLAGYGSLGGRRVMSEAAVRMGTGNLLPPGARTKGTLIDGAGFGAGGRVGLGSQAGTFGWAGAAGTIGFVDMRRALRAGLYAQFMPATAYPVISQFQQAVMADVQAESAA